MTDSVDRSYANSRALNLPASLARTGILVLLAAAAGVLALVIGLNFRGLPVDAPLVADSTPGELADWMAGQSEEEAPPSLLGGWAKQWAQQNGAPQADPEQLTALLQTGVAVWCALIAAGALIGIPGLIRRSNWTRAVFVAVLLGLDALLFLFPSVDGDSTLTLVLFAIVFVLTVLLFAHGRVTRVIGFFVAVSSLMVIWEVVKIGADSINYAVSVPQSAWNTTVYPSLDEALAALNEGEIAAVFADRNDLEPLMLDARGRGEGTTYADLRYQNFNTPEQVLIFPVTPALPGRLSVALRSDDLSRYTGTSALIGQPVGAVSESFALDRYLNAPRTLTLLDLNVFNDLNLPHLQNIAEAFMQPARRNGDFLLARILGDAGIFTLQEAVFGFVFGVIFGLLLGTVFAHSRLLERALLPYVVASQTVPILAIAPMVVIWLGASQTSVAVIAAYITFFPVTINTLRGLLSPSPIAVELMRSYAASRWTILWKLRFPAALPYIFTALKVSATSSVVGAIIGELPSGIGDGLGRAILDFSSDYSLVSTPKLWASIVTAAAVGVLFFVVVSVIERIVLRRYMRSA